MQRSATAVSSVNKDETSSSVDDLPTEESAQPSTKVPNATGNCQVSVFTIEMQSVLGCDLL